ncbi:MAG TPA: amylo-alpha-1,6-glucosidase [Ignavibacteriales bacterium]|nr:amylo-alpha-1,6-glucosidase [Ignavibacteriales bacterium]
MIKKLLLMLPVILISLAGCSGKKEVSLMDTLAIQVKDTTRAFSYTNKKFGQYYGETNAYFKDGWQGWTLKEQRVFNDYGFLIDGRLLNRTASTATVYPHMLTREYKDGSKERFFFADSLDLVLIELDSKGGQEGITFRLEGVLGGDDFLLDNNIVKHDLSQFIPGSFLFISSDKNIESAKKENGALTIRFPGEKQVKIFLLVSNAAPDFQVLNGKSEDLIIKKEKRIENLLSSSYVKTNNSELDKALMWAKISLDALVTEQDTKGIFAGLPWFNNYWGRDTFISLPGATFVTGNYRDARDILLSFAKYQDKNPSSPNYGRIPNRITLKETIYNTADGTPWFVIQSYNYFYASGDTTFLKEIYPAVKLAFLASVKNHVDDKGFLTHKDAETWMDAVGPEGPWSPRGNRANDIQALWYKQLTSTADLAQLMKDMEVAKSAMALSEKLSTNFRKYFVDENKAIVYDRLTQDGKPDSTLRPNLFFTLNEPAFFPDALTRLKILSNAVGNLVYPYGVLSLAQTDENFHPYHQYPPYYVKDAAYHNGEMWQWNTGPVVQTLCGFGKQDMAYSLTKELTHEILLRGAVGTLAELMDPLPREGEKDPRLSGTFSQAWSLAEYIRNFYQDYLGVKPDAVNKALYLLPTLPSEVTNVEFSQKVGSDILRIKYVFNDEYYRIYVDAKKIKDSLDLGIGLFNRAEANFQMKTSIKRGDKMIFEVPSHSNSLSELMAVRNNKRISISSQIYNEPPANAELYNNIKFAHPFLNKNLKALKGPGYSLLSNKEIKHDNPSARVLIDKASAGGDEKYSYPTNPNFRPGILDITGFTLKEDSENYYFTLRFKNLSNPGWHNEYGYQLTFTSIMIQNEDIKNGSRNAGANSGFTLPVERAFTRQVNVGGGFEVKEASGKILAAYLPLQEDIKNPLGSVLKKTIQFSVPKSLLGTISPASKITILTGAQDDHGGAGIGEFRNVGLKASEWEGGGKKSPSESNVFDYLFIN